VADDSLIDRELSGAVRLVQRITSLGRAARAKANIRTRQPLAGLFVRVQTPAEGASLKRMADQLIDELNVKALDVIEDEGDYFEYQVLPNLPVLGPKYGRDVGQIQRALQVADKGEIARDATAGRAVNLGGFEVLPEELLVSTAGKPGYAVAEEAGYAVAVSTEVTPELRDEGLARELVRRINEMRKSAGLDVADRIALHYDGDAELSRVLQGWGEYVSRETLATSLSAGNGTSGYSEYLDVDGMKLRVTIEKA
jgi:isoleucyl-tRNA synthetase